MHRRFLLIAAAVLFLGAGCAETPPSSAVSSHGMHHPDAGAETHMHGDAGAGLAAEAGNRIVLKEAPKTPGKGVLAFVLNADDGPPADQSRFQTVHEKLLHLIIVSKDLRTYRHLHPDFAKGQWRTEADLPAGEYVLYADFALAKEQPEVLRTGFAVGRPAASSLPQPEKDDRRIDGDVTATLARERATYRFTLRQNGAVPKGLRPYLGAYGHVLLFKHGDESVYVHAHPEETAPKNGVVDFTAYLPEPGRYTAFAQFDVDGAIRTFSYTFDVEALSAIRAGH